MPPLEVGRSPPSDPQSHVGPKAGRALPPLYPALRRERDWSHGPEDTLHHGPGSSESRPQTLSVPRWPHSHRSASLSGQGLSRGRVGSTCLVVMHPVEHNLRRPVPACGHISGHLLIRLACQPKVQDLEPPQTFLRPLHVNPHCPPIPRPLTLSSQSSFTATLLGFRSCGVGGASAEAGTLQTAPSTARHLPGG